jgi:hypothetical protein
MCTALKQATIVFTFFDLLMSSHSTIYMDVPAPFLCGLFNTSSWNNHDSSTEAVIHIIQYYVA